MHQNSFSEVDIGPTKSLSLRVSVAVLIRLLFRDPLDGTWTLALERKTTLFKTGEGNVVEVIAQPFGGGVRILDLQVLRDLVGDFHFDSERSRSERDFRLFIQPECWYALREYYIKQFEHGYDIFIDTDPGRELSEEIADALHVQLSPSSYSSRATGIVVEDLPKASENPRAKGYATVRLYRVYEAILTDPYLRDVMIKNDESKSDMDLEKMAIADAQQGGTGRANGILVTPLEKLTAFYRNLSIEARDQPVVYDGHKMAESVLAILDGITVPRYQRR